MPGLVKFESGSHWYNCRSGSPEPEHDADLRVARKKLLYPSVTTICKNVFKNDFLEKWKTEQVVLAAVNNPRQPHENEEQYANRIYQLSQGKTKDAADFGVKLHKVMERYPEPPPEPFQPWFDRYHAWHQDNVVSVEAEEKIVVDHDLGIAGQLDRVVTTKSWGRAIIDYKTQGVKVDNKGRKTAAFYEDWPKQLGFYAVCDAKETGSFPDIPTCISLVFDSLSPESPLFVKIWGKGEILHAYRQFVVGAWLWFSGNSKRKAFWPGLRGPWCPYFSIPMPE